MATIDIIKDVLRTELHRGTSNVTADTTISSLGFDILEQTVFTMTLEERCQIWLADELDRLDAIGDLAHYMDILMA